MDVRATAWPIDATQYVPHQLHGEDRLWPQSNCYVDLWIELLHSLELEPVACFAFTVAVDFEGDQWTFFKFPPGDLSALYGIDIQELNVWRPLTDHVIEQLSSGRLLLADVDGFFLPDTCGTSYKAVHQKTAIGIQHIDIDARQLGYFHHRGYYTLQGDDFDGVFGRGQYAHEESALPPYVELVKLDSLKRLPPSELTKSAVALLQSHLARRPSANPFARYRRRLREHMSWLKARDLATYHRYAFATMRQCGASYDHAATFLRWLECRGETGLEQAIIDFDAISSHSKTLMLKSARVASAKKDLDFYPLIISMGEHWESAMSCLVTRYGVDREDLRPQVSTGSTD